MKENIRHLLLLATTLFLTFLSLGVSHPLQDPNDAGSPLVQPNREMEIKEPLYLPQPNFDARMRLYLLSWLQNTGALQNIPSDRMRAKRTCRLNAGLSHSCDYKDTLDAIHEGMYLGSDMTPGKK